MNAVKAAKTDPTPGDRLVSPYRRGDFGEIWAGYQFLECVSRTASHETWTARAGDGADRLVQFISGVHWGNEEEEKRLTLLRSLQHDAVEPMELVVSDNKLALISDACAKSLATRLRECQAASLPGIPRPELLARMNEAAEALDDLYEEYGVRHLGLTPRHMALRNGKLRLLNYGVAELIYLPHGQQGALNSRYSAPKLFEESHPSSDAYSLALIYCELLTGVHPFPNKASQKPGGRSHVPPNLTMLPLADQGVLLRALHTDPKRRFAACTDFTAALCTDGTNNPAPAPRAPTASVSDAAFTPTTRARMRQLINGIVAGAAGDLEVREYRNARYLLHPGCRLEHQFFARLTRGVSKLMAEGFKLQWKAESLEMTEQRVVLLVPLTRTLWQRLQGIRPALRICIDMPQIAAVSEVRVRMEPVHCARKIVTAVMEEGAPKLLDSLRTFFQAKPERRSQARLPLDQALEVSPVWDDNMEGEAIPARAADISTQGMRFRLPCQPPSQLVNIRLPGWSAEPGVYLPASVLRTFPYADGECEVSVRFLVDEPKVS
jgi:Protein kinase domain/PilZ domain